MNTTLILALTVLATGMPPSAPEPAPPAAEEIARTQRLRFHSDPWINLHHFLYQWARAEEGIGSGRQAVDVPERDDLDGLSGARRATWRQAVDFYREHLAEAGHFDSDMLRIKARLLDLAARPGAGASDVLEADLVPGVAEQLDAAMAVYRAVWWPAHDRANRAWVADVLPWARKYEARYVPVLERSYGGTFDHVVRVDASAYSNWAGGYTSNRPGHTTIISTDEKVSGLYSLEMIYHEVSHTSELGRPNIDQVERAFEAAGKEAPGNLWHAIIFFTSGWVTRGISVDEGLPEHVPYMVSEGLVGFAGWRGLQPALERHWVPFLEGRATRDEALAGLVEELG